MALQVGLVGLPNVGKSTLFNALLARQVAEAANYPFCTIDPNVGVVEVPDDRLPVLAEVVGTEKIVPAAVEFVDIAGLVEGAHKGEGLGNKFLSHIREVDAIILVLRDFSDPNVVRSGSTTPESDAQVLLTELQLADLQTLEKISAPRANATKEEQIRFQAVEKLRTALENNQSTQTVTLTDEEEFEIKSFGLLTRKPIIVVLNTDEKTISQPTEKILGFPTLRLCAKLEAEMAGMELAERKELLVAFGIEKPILDILIRTAYQTLGLITFLTAGVKEVRAWPIVNGTKAPQAAATIHTDFEAGFIKAQIADYQDFVELKGWKGVKDAGKVRFEGKEYVMHESDIVEFMVNT